MWLILLAAYLCGAIPFGLLIVRAVAGVDLRTLGSGNIGATNAGRVLGKTWGAVILLLDALKGAGPALAAPWLAETLSVPWALESVKVLAGVAAILGHMFPIWLRFRGGKGVATALGTVCVLGPGSMLAAAVIFAATFAVTRIVSLSSILAAIGFGICQIALLLPEPFGPETWSLAVFSLAIPALIIVRHRSNIARLLRGEEPRFQSRKVVPPNTPITIKPPQQQQ